MLQIPEAAQWLPQNTPAFLESRGPLMLPEVARELGLNETQVVEALVRVRGERMELYLNGRTIEVPPGWRMSPGQTVWLTAHSTTQGLWVLRQHANATVAQRALAAAAAKTGGASTSSAASAGPAAAPTTAKAAPAVDPAQAAAAARVERAKVVLQARSEGQDPLHALAKRAGADGATTAAGKANPPPPTAPAFKPQAPGDVKPMAAQEAMALQRGGRVVGGDLRQGTSVKSALVSTLAVPANLGKTPFAAPAEVGMPVRGAAAPVAPGGRSMSGAMGMPATGLPLDSAPTRFQAWPQWRATPEVVAAVAVPLGAGVASSTTQMAPTAAVVNPKWAAVWSQAMPNDFIDWQQASARVRELAAHPPGMQAVLQLFQPQVVAALLQNPALAQWAQVVYRDRVSMRKPDAEGIKAMVEHALHPAESLLAKGQPAQQSGADVRTMLGDLLRLLKAQGDAHTASVRAALSDVESSQLDHLRALHQREWSFQCVLPFVDAPAVQLQLEHEAPDAAERAAWRGKWWVNLYTESEELGSVWMRSGVTSGADVDMQVWATREHVVRDARTRSQDLRDLLAEAGLVLGEFVVTHGEKPAGPARVSPPHGAVWDQQA